MNWLMHSLMCSLRTSGIGTTTGLDIPDRIGFPSALRYSSDTGTLDGVFTSGLEGDGFSGT
jgi:hypothetical protein